jgi:eukaryotic-like serine/threonine-protein kinase
VLMSLEKDPAKRYPSVERFADDLRRHLEGFPVTARSAGYFYQLAKFAGRHRASLFAAALIAGTLLAGIATTSWQARKALAQSERAERHFNEVRKLANVFMFDFHAAIADLPGSTPARQLLVENSLKYLETLAAESGNEPSLQRELAAAYEKVADVQGGFRSANLGDTAGAISSYRKALDIRKALSDANPGDRDLKRELLRNYGKLAETLVGEGDTKGALEATHVLLKLAQALASEPDASVADRRNLATSLGSLGFQLTRADQVGDGLLFLRQAVALYESLLESNRGDLETRRILGVTYGRMGETLLSYTDSAAEALRMQAKSLDIGQRLLEADPRNMRLRKMVAYSQLGVGGALARLKQPRAALERQLEAVAVLRDTLDADETNEIARYDAAFALGEASRSDLALGDLTSADGRLKDAIAILSDSSVINLPNLSDARVLLGVSYVRLGHTYALRVGQTSGARQRKMNCQQARHWFDLGRPILSDVEHERDPQWTLLTEGLPAEPWGEPALCAEKTRTAK